MQFNFYQPEILEKKLQERWEKENRFSAIGAESGKEKLYLLVEFPYPSGAGLHVGHPRPYTALDIIARKRRMQGYDVLFPMGFDAFGLPTENFAIKNKIHPRIATDKNIENFTKQLKSIGFSFDWNRVVDTTDPEYFKWTQFLFLKFFEHGLAYKSKLPVNWCVSCKIVLANEEVVDGACERCQGEVIRKDKEQWMLKITAYADKLLEGLNDVDYINRAKIQQENWIGKSNGAEIKFKIKDTDDELKVYTTRPDTLYGVTYMVVAPEHLIIEKYKDRIKNYNELMEYKLKSQKKSDMDRTQLSKEKTGVCIDGLVAINPVSNKEIPIWISDYVLMSYGTGAIMAVPAHDERDYEFAKKFNIPMLEVVSGGDITKAVYTGDGILINSPIVNGLNKDEAIEKMIEYIENEKIGERKTNYKLRDWVFSRQRYWGEPIPVVYCEKDGIVALPYSELPLLLPDVDSYEPTDNGESPLMKIESFVNTTCPKCKGKAKRETDTMPQWAGSSWYFLRYCDPHNKEEFASFEQLKYWLSVDWYNGGMEHTTLHLLYSRFWHRFLYDIGLVPTKEPYKKRTSHGMILAEDGQKMSKSRGNVINPDDVIREYGADTLRTYIMFIGDFESAAIWSTDGVRGCRRFLDRVWKLQDIVVEGNEYSKELNTVINKMIQKVDEDFEKMKFNTAIASMMAFINEVNSVGKINKKELETFLLLLNPVAPHITEEIWDKMGYDYSIKDAIWPNYDEKALIDEKVKMAVQVNGKLRTVIEVETDLAEELVKEIALSDIKIKNFIEGKEIVKIIVVANKIVNIVVK